MKSVLVGLVLASFIAAATSADSLDNLFNQANQDTIVKTPGPPVENPTLDRPVFLYFGNLQTQGAFATGWESAMDQSPATSLYYYLHLKGGIDVQPIPQARLIGTFSTYLPQELDSSVISNLQDGSTQSVSTISTVPSVTTSNVLSLDELFLDYTVADSLVFRVGKFVQTWGYGHLFNPGNIVTTTSEGVNLKGFVTSGPFEITGLVIGDSEFFSNKTHPLASELGYAGQINFLSGFFTAGLSAYEQIKEGATYDASIKTNVLGTDFYAEGLEYYLTSLQSWTPGALLGAYRVLQWPVPGKAIAEYWINGSSGNSADRSIGLGFVTDKIASLQDFQFKVKWLHSLYDGSGQVVTGVSFTPFPEMDIGLGVPWTYGDNGSTYILGNTDPESRRLAVFLTVNISLSFEKGK